MDDVQTTLARSALFRGVSTALVSEVSAGSEARLLGPRERLLAAGGANDKLHIVLSGALAVVPSDTAATVRLIPGECVGETSVLDDRAVVSDVVAEEATVVLSLDRPQLWQLIDASPELARNLLRIIAGRVNHQDVMPGESTRLKRYFERIATVDPLTGLHNRRWLDDTMARQVDRAQRSKQQAAVLMIDIDHFKRINDHYGHLTGDAVLGRVAQILMAGVRPQDLLARYGGEEFTVLLPNIDGATAILVAERLRHLVEATARDADSQDVPATTVSIGVAEMRTGDRLDDLLNRADLALARAKTLGRNRTCNGL